MRNDISWTLRLRRDEGLIVMGAHAVKGSEIGVDVSFRIQNEQGWGMGEEMRVPIIMSMKYSSHEDMMT